MRRRATKKAISMALAAAMAFSQVQVFAASSDIKGHWAESAITSWQDKGLISGYTDGTFKPDNSITRAEFASMVNKALGLTEKGDVPFSDVKSGSWYYDAISIAVKAGYCSGYEDGTFKPDATITRAEAAVMIALAKGLTQNTAAASGFADAANIPAWAKGYVGAVVSAGYMSGRPNGTFDATNTITRAEAVSSLDRAMGNTAVTDKDVVVTEDDTVIDGQTIEGNLIIDKAVGEGEVYVKNSTVAGNIIVQGGGDDSIYLENVTVKGKVIVEKSGVRVQFEGKTEATDVEVKAVCELKGRNFEGKVGTITIAEELGTSEAVKVNVPAEAVVVSEKASVYVNANVDKVTIASDAKDSKLEVTSSAKVGTVVADGKVAISGSGKVEKLEANADGITVSSSTTITKTEVADGVEKPSTPSTGGGGGGSSSSSTTSKTKTVNVTSAMITEKTNLQTIITENEKTKTNLTLNVPSNIAKTQLTGTLTYTGNGKLTINVTAAETAKATLAAAGTVTINAANATAVTITGKDFELTSLEFNAPKASVNTDVKATTVVLTDVATATISNAATTAVTATKAASVSVPNGQNTTVTVSDSTAISGNVSKVVASGDGSDIVTINGTVKEIEATAPTTVAGSGAIDKVTATAANITVEATAVKEVAVSGDADVTVNANVPKVTVADGATTTITVKDGVTVATVDTKENVTIDGSGKVDNVVVTANDVTTVTVNGTATVTTVENTGSANATVGGTSQNKPTATKKVSKVDAVLDGHDANYVYGEELNLANIKVTVTYDDKSNKVVDGTDTAVVVSGYNKETEGEQQITVSYAGVEASSKITVNVTMSEAQIFEAAKEKLAADENVTKLVAEAGLKNDASITLPTTITVGNSHEVTVAWASDNEAVAIKGDTVTVKQPDGADVTANVTATLTYSKKSDTATFTAKVLGVATLDKVVITAPEGVENGVKVGKTTEAFTVTAYDQHGEEFLVDETTWDLSGKESANTKFDSEGPGKSKTLTIGADEKATELTITATAKKGDKSVTSKPIVVKVLQESVATTVEITSKHTTVEQGGSLEFTGVVKDQYGSEIADKTITWEVSRVEGEKIEGTKFNGSTLTVAKTEPTGELTITAKCDKLTATTKITVTEKAAEAITNIKVGDRKATVNESQPVQVNDGKYTVGVVSYDEQSKTYTIPVNGTGALVGEASSSTGSGKAGKYVGIGVTLEGISDITNVYYSAEQSTGFEALTVDETLKTELKNNSFIFYLDATGNNTEDGAEVKGPVNRYIKLGENGDVITLKFDYTPYNSGETNKAPTVAVGQDTQTGVATPASSDGLTKAVAYTLDLSGKFEDADSDSLTYSVVKATYDNVGTGDGDASAQVSISGSTLTYKPIAAEASKTVTVVVKANDGKADSTGNITITVKVGEVPADKAIAITEGTITTKGPITQGEETPIEISVTGTNVTSSTLTSDVKVGLSTQDSTASNGQVVGATQLTQGDGSTTATATIAGTTVKDFPAGTYYLYYTTNNGTSWTKLGADTIEIKAPVQEAVDATVSTVVSGNNKVELTISEDSTFASGVTADKFTISDAGTTGWSGNPTEVTAGGSKTITLTFDASSGDGPVTIKIAADAFTEGTIVKTVSGTAKTE